MKAFRAIVVLSLLLTLGVGCDLDGKIGIRLPSWLEKNGTDTDAAAKALSVELKPGLEMTVRPSTLGVTGAIDEVFGRDGGAVQVRVMESVPEHHLVLGWNGASASGTLALGEYTGATTMLLPAFWQPGRSEAVGNGGLWLSRKAYDDLTIRGTTEWRLGVAENAFSNVSSAITIFNAMASQLSSSSTSSAIASPFRFKKGGTFTAFPIKINGKLELVRAISATSWFADALVLDNPENPLVLKMSIHPAAEPALKALEPAKVRWDALGYEITSISVP